MKEEKKEEQDYIEAFNQGYELSRELGLKSEILKDLGAGKNRIQAMQDGMQQYEKELQKQKFKDIIPPFDMEKFENRDIHIEDNSPEKDKDREIDI